MSHDPIQQATRWSQQEATALVRLVQMLPPAPKTVAVTPEIFDCKCLCGERREPRDFQLRRSDAGVDFREAVCRQCPVRKSQWDRLAVVVCAGCKTEIIRLAPHQDGSGFKYLPGHVYHALECPSCKKGIDKSAIVEKTLWDRRRYGTK